MDNVSHQPLASVLSAPYSDLEIRDSLEILDKQFVENTAESRRQLRINVQCDVIESNGAIIRHFARVSEQLTRIGSALDAMNNVVSEMQIRNGSAAAETAPVLEEASQLFAQKEDAHVKEVLLSAFAAHFTVSENDLATLTSSVEPVDDNFFRIFRNVKRIHADCQVLLASGNERVGTEIMDEAVGHLNFAFQKLFRWAQRELKTLSLESPQVNSGIRRALRVLAERPILFQNCLDFFSEARQKVIQDSFYVALTGSSPGSNVMQLDHGAKPIEVFAHDPLRYIGDILAWLHSAAVGEQETLEVLFIAQEGTGKSLMNNLEDGLKSAPWAADDEDEVADWDINASLKSLVNANLETVAKPIRAKIEQAIANQESSTLSYRINNLINFYRVTFEKLLGTESGIISAIRSVEESALRKFNNTIRDHVRSVKAELPEPPNDFSPPEFLNHSLKELALLMNTHSTSLAPLEKREDEFAKVLQQALDPYLEFCESISSGLSETNKHVFALNCLFAARVTMMPFEFTHEQVSQLSERITYHTDALAKSYYHHFAQTSGLRPLVLALSGWEASQNRGRLSGLQSFQLDILRDVSYTLDDFLPSALMDARSDLKRLTNPQKLDEVIQLIATRFIADFQQVEEAVVDILANEVEGGLEMVRGVWPRTTEEVTMLLS